MSQASEFKEFRFKPAERALFRELNQSPLILYPIKEAVTQTGQKISLMIQAHLGCVQYPDSSDAAKARRQLTVERKLVFERLNRLIRAVIDCKAHDRDSLGTKTALELARALAAESWEGRATQLTQVPNIGPVGMRKLASKGIRTVLQLADKEYDEIERLMSRQPPFGKNLRAHLDKFPRLSLEAAVAGHRIQPKSEEPVVIEVKAILRYVNRKESPNWSNRVPALTFLAETNTGTLVYFWRGSMRKLDKQTGFELKFSVGLCDAKDQVICHFSCEEIVGTIVSKIVEHKLQPSVFPARPLVADAGPGQRSRADSQGYGDDDDIGDSDLILAAEQALAHSSMKQTPRATTEADVDEYPSVEELVDPDGTGEQTADKFDAHLAGRDDGNEMDPAQTAFREPVRLANGRWQCNHVCSGGALTKSEKPCSHRCCKEGLDRPRKRPLQRPKRKRDEPVGSSGDARGPPPASEKPQHRPHETARPLAPAQVKRQKVQDAPLAQSKPTLSFSGPVQALKGAWQTEDFDDMDLECIDLSFTDDEDDDIFQNAGAKQSVARNQTASSVVKESRNGRNRQPVIPVPDQGEGGQSGHARVTPAQGGGKSMGTPAAQLADYQDDDLDDEDCLMLLEDSLSAPALATSTSTSKAFKSGASDEVVYEGISSKFTGTGASSPLKHDIQGEKAATMREEGTPDHTNSPFSVHDGLELSSGRSPGSSATAAVVSPTTMERTSTDGIVEALDGKSRGASNEPAWVAEFDPEFVDMFRGYVTFV